VILFLFHSFENTNQASLCHHNITRFPAYVALPNILSSQRDHLNDLRMNMELGWVTLDR